MQMALVGGLIGALLGGIIAFIPAMMQVNIMNQELDILRQGLEKKPELMVSIPDSDIYIGNNPYEDNVTLTLSTVLNRTFTVYVDNVGDGFAHIYYYAVFIGTDNHESYPWIQHIPPVLLAPTESWNFNWTLVPTKTLLESDYLDLTFRVGSAEGVVDKTIRACWWVSGIP